MKLHICFHENIKNKIKQDYCHGNDRVIEIKINSMIHDFSNIKQEIHLQLENYASDVNRVYIWFAKNTTERINTLCMIDDLQKQNIYDIYLVNISIPLYLKKNVFLIHDHSGEMRNQDYEVIYNKKVALDNLTKTIVEKFMFELENTVHEIRFIVQKEADYLKDASNGGMCLKNSSLLLLNKKEFKENYFHLWSRIASDIFVYFDDWDEVKNIV